MPIQALSANTVRAIGSSQVLTDPASLVKELIENAIDARATNISVEISANTLDVIQVRDNGHGIAPADRKMVCRRYCTSKIRDLADLKSVGGKWLGFRGEALASAAELSGGINVTTRVEGEDVAVTLHVGQNGEVQSEERASHPIGSTVKVTDFFKTLPVRKQTALKLTTKCLAKIKRQMQAYALARPSIRLSLKVLKAKNDKSNWVYAPKPGAGVEDAPFKVVGKNCASQCMWSIIESDGFTVQAFLPKPDAEVQRISNMGQYVSVDSRPVSTARGTLNQIIRTFKERLKEVLKNSEVLKDPFLCLNIVCPPESYDPNVEPAKDDVLFEDSSKVVGAAEKLLEACYERPSEQIVNEASIATTLQDPSIHVHADELEPEEPPSKQQGLIRPNMYGCEEDDLDCTIKAQQALVAESEQEDSDIRKDVSLFNPWVIAKMNAPLGRSGRVSKGNGQLPTPLRHGWSLEEDSNLPAGSLEQQEALKGGLPTPQPSSSPGPKSTHSRGFSRHARTSELAMTPAGRTFTSSEPGHTADQEEIAFLNARQVHRHRANDFLSARELLRDLCPHTASDSLFVDDSPPQGLCKAAPSSALTQDPESSSPAATSWHGASTLTTLGPRISKFPPRRGGATEMPDQLSSYHSQNEVPIPMSYEHSQNEPNHTQDSATGTPLNLIPEAPKQRRAAALVKRHANINKPFVSPVNDPSLTWFDHLPATRRSGPPQQKSQDRDIRSLFGNATLPRTNRDRAKQHGNSDEGNHESRELSPPSHPEEDGRQNEVVSGEFIHAAASAAGQFVTRPRRSKSSRLPLERVPDGWELQTCIFTLSVDIPSIEHQLKLLGHHNQYTYHTEPFPEKSTMLDSSLADMQIWANRLNKLLQDRYPAQTEFRVLVEDMQGMMERWKDEIVGSGSSRS